MQRFHLKTGFFIALAAALIASIPRAIRFDFGGLGILLGTWSYTFVLLLLFWLLHQFILQPGLRLSGTIKALSSVLLCALLSWVYHEAVEMAFPAFSRQLSGLVVRADFSSSQRTLMLLYRGALLGGFVYFAAYYLSLLFDRQKTQIELGRLKQENLEARLSSLKQQVSPHFLFNSLSTLRTIAPDPQTKAYVFQLSNVYRYLLNYSGDDLASLRDELDFTRSYLYILGERFEKALQVAIHMDESLLQYRLPPLALQILIENAIKHNIASAEDPLYITISTAPGPVLIVENNYQPKRSVAESTGKGLENINDRYRLLAGLEIEILRTAEKFTVKIPLLA